MLPAAARVNTRHDHRMVAQSGCRARRGSLVVSFASAGEGAGARAGVVAGRRVGPAVVRNRVKRRLRELLRLQLDSLSPDSMVVVRALPGAAGASYPQLGRWLDAGLRACEKSLVNMVSGEAHG